MSNTCFVMRRIISFDELKDDKLRDAAYLEYFFPNRDFSDWDYNHYSSVTNYEILLRFFMRYREKTVDSVEITLRPHPEYDEANSDQD